MIWLLLAGCYPADVYRDDHDEALCEWKMLCFAEQYSTCLEAAVAARTDVAEACEYDPSEARACVDGLELLECPAEAEELGFPTACDKVWDCP